MTRSDDVINEDGHDVIAAHTRVVRGMAAALAAIAATGAGVTAAAANVMFTFALDTKAKRSMFNMPHEETPKGIEFDMSEQLEAARWFEEAKQSVTLRSHDGLKLHGWLLDPDCSDPQPHLYAICCHGYAGEPAEMAKWAHRYAQLGFTVLLPAQRAHELSEGRYVGMGLLESDDLLGWVSLITAADPDARILLHGNSMGAATVMMAAGDARLPRNVVAAISDCGYSSVVSQFTDNAEEMFRLPHSLAALLVKVASHVSKRKAGYRFEDASCVKALRHATIPMMFIHGGADTFVNPKYLDINYNACASIDREKLLIPGADHTMSASTDPDRYWRRVNYGAAVELARRGHRRHPELREQLERLHAAAVPAQRFQQVHLAARRADVQLPAFGRYRSGTGLHLAVDDPRADLLHHFPEEDRWRPDRCCQGLVAATINVPWKGTWLFGPIPFNLFLSSFPRHPFFSMRRKP